MLSCAQLFCSSTDCSPPGSSVHGIFQARILEQFAISYFKGFFLTQGLNPCLISAALAVDSFPLPPPGKPFISPIICHYKHATTNIPAHLSFWYVCRCINKIDSQKYVALLEGKCTRNFNRCCQIVLRSAILCTSTIDI